MKPSGKYWGVNYADGSAQTRTKAEEWAHCAVCFDDPMWVRACEQSPDSDREALALSLGRAITQEYNYC